MSEEWRDWRLVWYSTDLRSRPPQKPTQGAELSGDGAWATAYVERDGRPVVAAMWMRYRMPTRETLAREAEARRAREALRLDVRRPGG